MTILTEFLRALKFSKVIQLIQLGVQPDQEFYHHFKQLIIFSIEMPVDVRIGILLIFEQLYLKKYHTVYDSEILVIIKILYLNHFLDYRIAGGNAFFI